MYNKNNLLAFYRKYLRENNNNMEQNYNFFNEWEKDLEVASLEIETPSKDVLDAIIDYSMIVDFFSKTLNERISICLN